MKSLKIKIPLSDFTPLLRSKNAQVAMMVLKPGGSSSDTVENEHPEAEQWLFVLSGKGSATVGKRRVRLSPHTLLLIEKREKHRIINTGSVGLVTLNIYCPPAYAKDGDVLRRAGGS